MKKVILFVLVSFMFIMVQNTYALEHETFYRLNSIEDGLYVETLIEEEIISTYANQTKKGSKTKNYKDSKGNILYSVKVNGTFTYNGSSSVCTSSSVTANSYNKTWKVSSKSASKSKNVATAKATMKQYYDGTVVQTKNSTVTLTCSAKGVLS